MPTGGSINGPLMEPLAGPLLGPLMGPFMYPLMGPFMGPLPYMGSSTGPLMGTFYRLVGVDKPTSRHNEDRGPDRAQQTTNRQWDICQR